MEVIGKKLPLKKQKAIIALLEHGRIKDAAITANIGETTLYRWLQDPPFKRAYHTAKKEAYGLAMARIQQTCSKAVDTLLTILSDDGAPPNSRVSAARIILEWATKSVELEEIEERLERLEKNLKTSKYR